MGKRGGDNSDDMGMGEFVWFRSGMAVGRRPAGGDGVSLASCLAGDDGDQSFFPFLFGTCLLARGDFGFSPMCD